MHSHASSPTRSPRTGLPSSSTTSTRRPAAAADLARTAVTVVLPTPPLPATMVTREADSSGTGSTDSGGTFAQTSDRPAQRRGWRSACSPLATPRRSAPRRPPEPSTGPVDVLQVSGLFDPIVVGAIDDAIAAIGRRRRPGAGAAGQHARRGDRSRRHGGAARAHRGGAPPDRRVGRAVRRPAVRNARPAAGRRRRHRHGARCARRPHRRAAEPERCARRPRRGRGSTAQRLARA